MSDNVLEFPGQDMGGEDEDFSSAPNNGYTDPDRYTPATVTVPVNPVVPVPTLPQTIHKYVPYIALGLGIFAVYMIMKDR